MDMELNGIKVSNNILDVYSDGRHDTIHHIILDLDNKKFLGYVGTREDSLKAVEGTNLKVVQAQWDGDEGAWDGIVNGPDLGNDEPHWAYQKWEKDIDSNYGEINDLISEWFDHEDEEGVDEEFEAEESVNSAVEESYRMIEDLEEFDKRVIEAHNTLNSSLGRLPNSNDILEYLQDKYEEYEDVDCNPMTLVSYLNAISSTLEEKGLKEGEYVDSVEKELFEAIKEGRTNIL